MKKYVPPFFALASLALIMSACGGSHDGGSGADNVRIPEPVPATTGTVKMELVERLCELPGTIVPKDRAVVSARVMGTVDKADFAIGESVSKGQLLVTLSAPEMLARVDQAQAALDKAERDFARESELLKSGASTAQTVRDLQEQVRIARAALSEAQSLNSYTRVSAPFDGYITRKMVGVGDFAAPGTPLFEIDGRSGLRVEASVPDSFPMLPLGTTLTVKDSSHSYSATLSESSGAADPASRTRLAKLDLVGDENSVDLRSGQFVRVMWSVGKKEVLSVPASAVSLFGQIQRVFVLDGNNHARLRIVKIGESYGERVQVLSGLSAGDVVVLDPPSSLKNGTYVEVE